MTRFPALPLRTRRVGPQVERSLRALARVAVVCAPLALIGAGALPASAQRTVPTTVENEETQPVPTADPGYRFVGLSTQSVDGAGGLRARNAACQTNFGENARMCTSGEIRRTPSLFPTPATGPSNGWVQPEVEQIVFNPSTGDTFIVEGGNIMRYVYGNQPTLSCSGWWSNDHDDTGRLFTNSPSAPGAFTLSRCDVARRVSCCAPHAEYVGRLDAMKSAVIGVRPN